MLKLNAITILLLLIIVNANAQIWPVPTKASYEYLDSFTNKTQKLPQNVAINIESPDTDVMLYAKSILTDALSARLKVEVTDSNASTNREQPFTVIKCSAKGTGPSEGYKITFDIEGNAHIIRIVGNDANGVLYGCLTLQEIMEECMRRTGYFCIPPALEVVDAPVMRTRLLPTMLQGVDKDDIDRLDWMARCRFNGFWKDPDATPEHLLRKIAQEANRRGMTLYAVVSYRYLVTKYKHVLCPYNSEDITLIEGLFEKAARSGCKGFVFIFDDIEDPVVTHVQNCQKCKDAKVDGLAAMQRSFIKIMANVAQKHGIDKMIVCPTPYRMWWLKKYNLPADYFKKLVDAPELSKVLVFHCEFYPDYISELKESGLRNYIWWNNGLWTSKEYYGLFVGCPRIALSWGGFRKDDIRGPYDLPKAKVDLSNLGKLTEHVYPSPAGDPSAFALGGYYAWNPAAYCTNEESARRSVIEKILGIRSYAPYKIWEDAMIAWTILSNSKKRSLQEKRWLIELAHIAETAFTETQSQQEDCASVWGPIVGKSITRWFINEMKISTQKAVEWNKVTSNPPK